MGSVTSPASGLAYLTQPGGLLSNLPSAISTSALQSASPQDIVSLSAAAIQVQITDGLFGISSSNPAVPGLPLTANSGANSSILPGISSADLTNATPQQQAAINDEALSLQQTQALFNPPTSSNLSLIG